jgi:hypothetical protein
MYDLMQIQSSVSNTPQQSPAGTFAFPKVNRLNLQAVIDFYLQSMMEGLAYQINAGTITTPLVGDVVITDTAAEIALDAPSGVSAIAVFCNIAVRLGTGTLHEYAIKSVAGISSGGDAFVPLPLFLDGTTAKTGSRCSARVDPAGGVTVTAELATTTRRHWGVSNPLAVGAGHEYTTHNWEPRLPPTIQNNACLYVQIAATTTGPSYYANLDFVELRPENF